jgi:hypothetical protein
MRHASRTGPGSATVEAETKPTGTADDARTTIEGPKAAIESQGLQGKTRERRKEVPVMANTTLMMLREHPRTTTTTRGTDRRGAANTTDPARTTDPTAPTGPAPAANPEQIAALRR